MKILLTSDVLYPSQHGGFAASVYFLAKALAKHSDIEVYVLTTDFDIKKGTVPTDRWIKKENINLYYMSVPKFNRIFKLSLYFLINRGRIDKIINKIDFDIVHLNSFFSYITHHVAGYAVKRDKKVVISPHGELFSNPLLIKSFKKNLFFKLKSVKAMLSGSNTFHFTSIEEKSAFKKFLTKFNIVKQNKEISVIPNIADDSIFEIPKKRDCDYNFKYILFLGRISRIKNIEMLIKAFSNIKKDDLKLIIAGETGEDPYYSKELKQLVNELSLDSRIIFTEKRVLDGDKRALYQNAEATVLCSHSENFGMVVIESLAQKTPVIAVKTTPWEGLESHRCGFWIDKDENSLKLAIEKVLSLTDSEKNQFASNAFKYAKEFSAKKLSDRYREMYNEITNMK